MADSEKPDHPAITLLARKCAAAGLRIRDARFLFDALYMADAIALAGGNKAKAARIAGVQREVISRNRDAGARLGVTGSESADS